MKQDSIYLSHIIDSILAIEKFIKDVQKEEFIESRLIQDAAIRELEVIGEAVKNISSSTKQKYPDIPWKEVAGMRDKLIHEYFGVDINLVWEVTRKDLPDLKGKVIAILDKLVK